MVTNLEGLHLVDGKYVRACVFYCLSSDEKPGVEDGAGNGSAVIEMDTSRVYFFAADTGTWHEWGAEPAVASTLSASPSPSSGFTPLSSGLNPAFEPGSSEPDAEVEVDQMPELMAPSEDGEER